MFLIKNPLSLVIIISVICTLLIRYLSNKKYKKIMVSERRKAINHRFLNNNLGRLFFIFKKVNH